MTYRPANISPADPVYISPLSRNGTGAFWKGVVAGTPSGGTIGLGNRAFFNPFYIGRSYSLARWWWLNGAIVGTDYIQTAIYDENLNLLKASPRTLSAGTVNQLQFANPGIHGTNVTSGTDATDATTYTTASVTLKAGVLYLMSVENTKATAADAVSSIDSATGGYPTFTSRSTTQFNATLSRESIWSAVPTADFTGTLRINFGATQTNGVWSLNAFYHVDTASTDGVVQNAVGTGNSTTPLATLAAFGSANNATFGAFGAVTNGNATPSTGYLELSDQAFASASQDVVFRPDNDTTVDTTYGGAIQWGACAVEIKSLGTGAVALPPMRGYLAIHCSGTTAQIFRTTASEAYRSQFYIQSSLTTGFPTAATFTGANVVGPFVFGFTSRSSP